VSGAPTRRALATILAVAFLASCTESGPPTKSGPFNDVEGAPKLARDAGALLLQVSAYDYGLAGALAGDQRRTVAAARYGAVMRGTSQSIATFNAAVLAGTLDRTGPIREKLVPLADGLSDLARDGESGLWLIPLLMIVVILCGLRVLRINQIIFALITLLSGLVSVYLMNHERMKFEDTSGLIAARLTGGFWLGLLSAIGVVISGAYSLLRRPRSP